MNFETCGYTENEKRKKIVLRTALRPNQIEFSHGLNPKETIGESSLDLGKSKNSLVC